MRFIHEKDEYFMYYFFHIFQIMQNFKFNLERLSVCFGKFETSSFNYGKVCKKSL